MNKLTTFYAIVASQTLSLLGSRMTSLAIGIWVFATTGRASPLLLTSFFTELPGMLFGSLAGVVVDRWDRRLVMILADAGQAIGSLLLMLSFLSGRFELWHLYTLAFLQGTFPHSRDRRRTLRQPCLWTNRIGNGQMRSRKLHFPWQA